MGCPTKALLAGTMGGGIELCNCRQPVTIVETRQDALAHGLEVVRIIINMPTAWQQDVDLGRIEGALEIEKLVDCELVIEAVFEDMDLKKRIFSELDKICETDTILAIGTEHRQIAVVTFRT